VAGKNRMEQFRTMINTGGFADVSGTDASGIKLSVAGVGKFFSGIMYSLGFILLLMFVQAIGSARLSYCYNISIGNSEGVAFLYAILCFIFPSLYYPYYSFFLNTACSAPSRMGFMGGAKRGGGRR